jgi:hypothetical protein
VTFARTYVDSIHSHRLCDVLESWFSQILETNIDLSFDLPIRIVRQADTSGLRVAFKPCGNVDAVPVDIVGVDHHIAQVDANSEIEAHLVLVGLLPGDAVLPSDGARDSVYDASEFHQNAVAHQLNYAPSMLGNEGFDHERSQPLEARERAHFVLAHEPAITDYIGSENGSETPLQFEAPFGWRLAGQAAHVAK